MAQQFRILYQDDSFVAIDKPPGFSVHPPEDKSIRISRSSNGLQIISNQIQKYVYPVHRLDRGTSGVVLYALDVESAKSLASQFQNREVNKKYYAVVRGFTEDNFICDRPLDDKESYTEFTTFARLEIPKAVGKFETARYSLVEAKPKHGRMHQIRRHLMGLSHPIVGDKTYGDRKHNKFMSEEYGFNTLMLKAHVLEFIHPQINKVMKIESKWTGLWHKVFDLFGICPIQKKRNDFTVIPPV